jgi:dihydrodipicolinate synthase/N-acetylneuraminate lyase
MIEAVRPHRPDFSFLTGWDTVLLPMLLVGCDGGTNASSGVAPELTRKLYDLAAGGRLEEARRVQTRIIKLFDSALYAADFPEGFRVGVSLRGFRMGTGRQPLSEDHRTRLEELEHTLGDFLAEEGLDTGSPDRNTGAALGPWQITQIVDGVLAELGRRGVTLP